MNDLYNFKVYVENISPFIDDVLEDKRNKILNNIEIELENIAKLKREFRDIEISIMESMSCMKNM